jgi:hypothetical protein
LVQYQRETEAFRNRSVGNIIMCWSNAARCHYKVVVLRHALGGLDDFRFIVGDDFDALEVDAEGEAEFGEPGGVGIDGLSFMSVQPDVSAIGLCMINWERTLPPSTSSPMIRQAAVLIIFLLSAIGREMCGRAAAAEACR